MSDSSVSRRSLLKGAAGMAAVASSGTLLGACSSLKGSGPANGSSTTIKIGYVSPQTGPLAGFASADNFVLTQVKDLIKTIKGRSVEIVVKDTQSNPNRAADVARELILSDKVDIVLSASTPDTTNPVASQCEANGIPCVSTIAPWEAWFFGRGGKPETGFDYTTFFFFGMEEITGCFISMWDRMATNKKVGALWPNDNDANAFRAGFPPIMQKRGYSVVDGGKYENGSVDFSAQISAFKNGQAELFTCTPLPPDFAAFWKQAAQQGYKPKLATVAKVLLFPSEAEALGPLVNNIATDCWWSPFHPYKSTLNGQSAKDLAAAFRAETGRQWTQALGSIYSLFEIANQALTSVDDPRDRDAVAHALKTMKIEGMGGPLDFGNGPVPGVAVQKVVGVQWREGKDFPWEMYVVDNSTQPDVPTNGDLLATG